MSLLWNIKKTGDIYYITDDHYRYEFDFEMVHHLRKYITGDPRLNIANWYEDLDIFKRKKVKRIEL